MDRNFALALALSFLVLALWTVYTGERQPQALQPGAAPVEGVADPGEAVPGIRPAFQDPAAAATAGAALPERAEPVAPEERIRVDMPLYTAEFTNRGGGLVHWELNDYHDRTQPGNPPVELTTVAAGGEVALATPLEELGFGDLSAASYRMERTGSSIRFELERDGVQIRKTYTLDESSYAFRLGIEVVNGTDRYIRPTFRTVWPVRHRETVDYQEHSLAAYVEGSLEQSPLTGGGSFLGFGGGLEQPLQYVGEVEWAGSQTRYFLAAMLPDVPRDAAARFSPLSPTEATVELAFQAVDLPPGQRVSRELRVYLGPKETERLDAIGAHLDDAIQKGWFPPLTSFFVWLLKAAYDVIGNYGLAIIAITILVRLLLAPIMAKQVKSMKRMGEMQPRMKEIQEKYADDRTKQSEEMMKLWKESGFNPMAGCLPIFLQLPVFLGLYYALQGSIALRQEPFFGWINDLSAPETLFVIPGLEIPVRLLPLLMGASMLVQQRITPTTMDPAQARMMNTVMPVMFTFLFYQFASGLVLYWFVSNVLGILQQFLGQRGGKPTGVRSAGAAKPAKTAGG